MKGNKKKIIKLSIIIFIVILCIACKVYLSSSYELAFGVTDEKVIYDEICARTMIYNDYSYKKYGDDRYKLSGAEAVNFINDLIENGKPDEIPDNVKKYMKWYSSIYPCGAINCITKHDEYISYVTQWGYINYIYGKSQGVYGEYKTLNEKDEIRIYKHLSAYHSRFKRTGRDAEALLTFDEIMEFYSSERDENGEMRIKNIPQQLSDYLNWFFDGDDNHIFNFRDGNEDQTTYAVYLSKAEEHYQENVGDLPEIMDLEYTKMICNYLEDNWDEIIDEDENRYWTELEICEE